MVKRIGGVSWVVLAGALMVSAGASRAWADEKIVATVPFDFIVGDSRLPAGDYVVREMAESGVLSIISRDGQHVALVLTIPVPADETPVFPQLVFERFEGHHFLARIVPHGNDGREVPLEPALMEQEIRAAAQNE